MKHHSTYIICTPSPSPITHTHTQSVGAGASAGADQPMQEDSLQQSSSSYRHDSFDQPPNYDQTWDDEDEDWETQQQESGECVCVGGGGDTLVFIQYFLLGDGNIFQIRLHAHQFYNDTIMCVFVVV